MSEAPAATVISNVNAFYKADKDLALICLTFDAGKFDPFNFETIVHLGTEAGFSVIDPERFTDADRGFFYRDYLRRYAIIATNQRSPLAGLVALGRQLGLHTGRAKPPPIPAAARVGRNAAQAPFVADKRLGSEHGLTPSLPPTLRIPQRIQMKNLRQARATSQISSAEEQRERLGSECEVVQDDISVVFAPPNVTEFDHKRPTRAASINAWPTEDVEAEDYLPAQAEVVLALDLGPAGNMPQAKGKAKRSQRLPTVPARPANSPENAPDPKLAPATKSDPDEPVAGPSRMRRDSSVPLFSSSDDQDLVRVRFQRGDTWMPGRLRNLTTKDIKLAASAAPPAGSILRVSVTIGELNAVLTGTVLEVINTEGSTDGATTFRCEFRGVSKKEHERLVALLRQAKKTGMSLAPPPARRGRRFAISWPLAVMSDGHRFNASALDISEHGLFLATDTLLRSDNLLFGLPLDRAGESVRGKAIVARKVSDQMARSRGLNLGYGLEIESFHVQDQDEYAAFLQRVRNRSQKHIIVAGEGAHTVALADCFRSAGYAVSRAASVDMMMKHRTQFESNAPDLAMMDGGSLSVVAQREFHSAFREQAVPMLLAGDQSPHLARARVDQMVEI
jgi:hypothetical protein